MDGPSRPDSPTRARDHLANERTYLAWLRTAAAVMALGLAIAGFGHAATYATFSAGALLVAAGTGGVVYATVRYRQVLGQIERQQFDAASQGRAAVAAAIVLISVVAVALVLLAVGAQ